jgi:alcohol dehydrogenase/propanol-preferring alcohol dehydrogenase
MRAAQFAKPGAPLELVEREIPTPGRDMVRIKVQACGVCHSDWVVASAGFPGIEYPRVPGHEVAGVIDALGAGVTGWKVGQRVGVGWHGGQDGTCDPCRRGNFFGCESAPITGVTVDGGYAEYMVARASALARLPASLAPKDAAPLLCAGVTTFNGLRSSGARPGELVAVHGIGGLGHLAVQFAAKMGFNTVAIARGKDKEKLARELGAANYIDSNAVDPAQELQKLGGARVIAETISASKPMSAMVAGLGLRGTLLVIGASGEPLEASGIFLLLGNRTIQGHYSGTSIDSEDTLAFSVLEGVRSMNEVFPLDRAREAFDRMMSGAARFRVVLEMPAHG